MHDNAWIYDLEVGGYTEDIPYWTSLVSERKATSVLDLACGTGRITFPLAAALAESTPDARVVGLDNSPAFLEAARKKLGDQPIAVQRAIQFVEGNMAKFCLEETFDVILIGFNSFMYIYEQADQISCLESVRQHLGPDGCFAFDILTPALDYLAEAQRTPALRLELELSAPEQGVKQLLRFSTERYDATSQLSHSNYLYEIFFEDGRHDRFTDQLDWQMIFPREMGLLACLAGLKTVAKYGDYGRAPFNARSRQMLWVLEPGDKS
jgi:SAM-dependent methyltransferase